MILDKRLGIIGIALWLSCLILIQTGCMAASALKGKKGVSVDFIKTGISKAEVEEVLGPPVRKWMTTSNICYCVYKYVVAIDHDTLPEKRVFKKIAVSYDSQDMVVPPKTLFATLSMTIPKRTLIKTIQTPSKPRSG